MSDHDQLCPTPQNYRDRPCFHCDLIAKVRADERAAIMSRVAQDMTVDREKWTALARSTSMADLRAKVEALPTMGTLHSPLNPEPSTMVVVLRDDVLALFDGSGG